MKTTRIHRDWPADEEADALAAEWQRETEQNRSRAGQDLQRSMRDLECVAERDGLTPGAHDKVSEAIRALRAALADQVSPF